MIIRASDSKFHKISTLYFVFFFFLSFVIPNMLFAEDIEDEKKYLLNESSSNLITPESWDEAPSGGDTIFISARRTKPLRFTSISGEENNPIVVINYEGQVKIDGRPDAWGALVFENCLHIKVTGEGHKGYKYGFLLAAKSCGLAFAELSSDCEAAFLKISHEGFFGIVAKKDYHGNPPMPIPVFSGLHIHDCFIEDVVEGMYLGETKSPGMEFKNVRIYNNIVRNTNRESIQVANMVEDVEIYNNTLLAAGKDELAFHGNLLQIGDNTVATVYNNILIGAPAYGIISMGSGNNYYQNNFVSGCKGVFVDDRKFTLKDSLVVFSGNYFSEINNDENEVIRNMNGENYFIVENNVYDNEEDLFYRNYFKSNTNFQLENNIVAVVEPIIFTNSASNDYSLTATNPAAYLSMGAPGGPEFFYSEGDGEQVEVPESEQIVLNGSMVVDEVLNGSYYSALYLVDEQDATPENEIHPVSQNWKPYWNMNNGPYHVYIDLGGEYTLTNIAFHDMHNSQNLDISIGEPGNWEYLFTEACTSYKKWSNNSVNTTTRYIRLSMNENVNAAVNEIIVYGYAPKEEAPQVATEEDKAPQIVLKSETTFDEVQDGSYWSPTYLVDEQDSTIENSSHPTSQSWKPHWNMDKGPYHVYFDLNGFYELTTIALHDMNNAKNLDVSVGEPGNWEHLFTESCDSYKSWKVHEVNVTTRYIRLSMNESVYAAINEILLFGYAVGESNQAKSASINNDKKDNTDLNINAKDNLQISNIEGLFIQNPVQDNLKIHLPVELNENFTIEVYNLEGRKLIAQGFEKNNSSQLMIDISNDCEKDGIYIMKYRNIEGTQKALKFLKQSF